MFAVTDVGHLYLRGPKWNTVSGGPYTSGSRPATINPDPQLSSHSGPLWLKCRFYGSSFQHLKLKEHILCTPVCYFFKHFPKINTLTLFLMSHFKLFLAQCKNIPSFDYSVITGLSCNARVFYSFQ